MQSTTDCICNYCSRDIRATDPRFRCSRPLCDEVHICISCGSASCPNCARPDSLYWDRASPLTLRWEVFRESESMKAAEPSTKVVTRIMVNRAFRTYGERPLLGEPSTEATCVGGALSNVVPPHKKCGLYSGHRERCSQCCGT